MNELTQIVDQGFAITVAIILLYFLLRELRTSLGEILKLAENSNFLAEKICEELGEIKREFDRLFLVLQFADKRHLSKEKKC